MSPATAVSPGTPNSSPRITGTEELVTAIDRFLMFYVDGGPVCSAPPWLDACEGGIDALRRVVLEDSLGIADDLDDAMSRHVGSYRRRVGCRPGRPRDPRAVRVLHQRPRVPGDSLRLCGRARPAPARPDERTSAVLINRNDPGVRSTTTTEPIVSLRPRRPGWIPVCDLRNAVWARSRPPLVHGVQIALFRTLDDSVFAVQQHDPYCGAMVISAQSGKANARSHNDRRVADVQTGLRPHHWRLPRATGQEPIALHLVGARPRHRSGHRDHRAHRGEVA